MEERKEGNLERKKERVSVALYLADKDGRIKFLYESQEKTSFRSVLILIV